MQICWKALFYSYVYINVITVNIVFEIYRGCPFIVKIHPIHTVTNQVLIALLLGGMFRNVAEYHMTIERVPDRFDPTLRSLMAHFKL